MFYCGGRTCVWKIEENKIRTERERSTKSITLLSKVCATVTNEQQPLQKVTKSLYIVTHLGQLPFILFTQMARTWALKEDSVNTTIIHWYSTRIPMEENKTLTKVCATVTNEQQPL